MMSFQKVITAISLGMALHYTEIQKAWEVCGSDTLCKSEKLLLYMTGILGTVSPSIALSHFTNTLVNKAWVWGKGHPLLDKNSYWGPTLINLGIYSTMEQYSSYGVNFVRYATDCLKSCTCEGYDVLVWVSNMKVQYCNKTELSPSTSMQFECAEGDRNCNQVEDEGLLGRIQNRSDWCVAFFNELPLMSSAVFIWATYLVSFGWQRDGDNEDEKDDHENGGDRKDGDGNGGDGKDENRDNQDDSTKKPPKETPKKTKDKPTTTQVIHATCPFCKLSKRACIPKPLSISCQDCGNNIRSKSNKDPVTQQTPAAAVNPNFGENNYSTPRNLFPSSNVSKGVTSTLPIPNHKVDTPVICHQEEEEDSKKCTCTLLVENSEGDTDSSDISDDEELYKTYMTLAIDHKDELESSLGCANLHADHVHKNAQINGTSECNASHHSDSDDTEEEDFY